ncbi:unnamed protein product [Danaus chrysippus]|uniref:(African queen) hypothetical protein n=1 Tax=Danaus chrysippus TaxID=151541 RepID=A0A8J2VWW4_9NEOP|nr:unnamed protein product [Danaus chrysippus]
MFSSAHLNINKKSICSTQKKYLQISIISQLMNQLLCGLSSERFEPKQNYKNFEVRAQKLVRPDTTKSNVIFVLDAIFIAEMKIAFTTIILVAEGQQHSHPSNIINGWVHSKGSPQSIGTYGIDLKLSQENIE